MTESAFERALENWQEKELFGFEDVVAAVTQGDYDQLMSGLDRYKDKVVDKVEKNHNGTVLTV